MKRRKEQEDIRVYIYERLDMWGSGTTIHRVQAATRKEADDVIERKSDMYSFFHFIGEE